MDDRLLHLEMKKSLLDFIVPQSHELFSNAVYVVY